MSLIHKFKSIVDILTYSIHLNDEF